MEDYDCKGKAVARQVVVELKGHPGSGKSTLDRSISAHLRCPILDKDDLYSAALPVFYHLLSYSDSSNADRLLNDLSYQSLWNLAVAQLRLGLSVVIDSPFSCRSSLERLLQIASADGRGAAAAVLAVECSPRDEQEWRRRHVGQICRKIT